MKTAVHPSLCLRYQNRCITDDMHHCTGDMHHIKMHKNMQVYNLHLSLDKSLPPSDVPNIEFDQ